MNKFKGSLVLLFILCITILSACGDTEKASDDKVWEKIQDTGKIVVGTSGTLIASSYYDEDENLTGYDVEIMREVGALRVRCFF